MSDDTIEIDGAAFGSRFANLIADRRRRARRSRRELARRSDGAFTAADLRAYEAGQRPLDDSTVAALAALYEADLAAILPTRLPLTITDGTITTAGVSQAFSPGDTTSLLAGYLTLVRRLRRQQQEAAVDIRRADLDALAGHLGETPSTVLERLGVLMGATQTQRKAMLAMLVAGAAVIGLATTSVAALDGGDPETPPVATVPADPASAASTIAPATATTSASTPGAAATVPAPAATTVPATSPATAAAPPTTAAPAPATTEGTAGRTPPGGTVATGIPPVPPPDADGMGDDPIVATGEPPIPPEHATGTGEPPETTTIPDVPPPAPPAGPVIVLPEPPATTLPPETGGPPLPPAPAAAVAAR